MRVCGWCKEPIAADVRRDAKYCSKRCRQAAWRFRQPIADRNVALHRHTTTLHLAYADPPYPGTSARYYSDHPDYDGEVDHAQLITRLTSDYPDGWALSTSAAALPEILALCPTGVRVAAWFRGERPTRSYRPLAAWEPVLYHGGRAYIAPIDQRRTDALVHVARARRTDPDHIVGAKPAAFAYWMFDLLGALPGDTLDDLYPGSGGIMRAWRAYTTDPSRDDRYATPQLPLGLG